MFNLKEIKKIVATAVVVSAMAVYAHPSFAEELDCSGKTGYEKLLCEEQKALNEKAQKASDNIDKTKEKADEKAKKNTDKAKEKADKKAKEAKNKEIENKGLNARKGSVEENQDKIKEAQKLKEEASKKLTQALKDGDEKKAKEAQSEMQYYNQEIAERNANIKELEKSQKEADKAQQKAEKEAEKAQKKADKEAAKAQKKVEDAAKKAEKNANKDKEKADKEVKKLQEKCEKNPEKCDTAKLQAALAKQEAAAAAADAAKKQREDIDGTTQRRADEAAAAAAQEAAMAGAENAAGDVMAATELADADAVAEVANAPKRCEGATGIFEIIACKAITTLADLRTILYIFAGFGLIAFAWSAIFNKISWKHFAQICIALFLLSMMGSFIGYFGYDSSYRALKFGEYLEDGHQIIDGSGNFIDGDASGDVDIPDATETEKAAKKWSLSDLKSSIQSGISAVQKAHSAYQTAKSTVENVVNNAKTIGNAIKNGEGGLDGILNTMTTVAGAAGNIMNSGQLLANNLAANIGGISEDITQAGLSAEQRELRAKNQKRLAELEDQCSTGKCNDSQKKELASLQKAAQEGAASKKTGIQNWLDNDGKGGGATIMAGINKVGNITNNVSNAVTNTANAAQNGMAMGNNIGGGALGNIFGAVMGAATGVGEGVGMIGDENFNFKSEAKKREEKAAAEENARKSSNAYVADTKKEGNKTTYTMGDGSKVIVDSDTGVTATIGKDGTITSTSKSTTTVDENGMLSTQSDGGSVIVQDKNGNRTTTNSNGTVVKSYVDEDGNRKNVNISDIPNDQITTPDQAKTAYWDTSNQKQKYSGTASITEMAKNTQEKEACEKKGGTYDVKTKKCTTPEDECKAKGGTYDSKTKKCNMPEAKPDAK